MVASLLAVESAGFAGKVFLRCLVATSLKDRLNSRPT
jgi:hypothetical protein